MGMEVVAMIEDYLSWEKVVIESFKHCKLPYWQVTQFSLTD